MSPARPWIALYSEVSSACRASSAFLPDRLRSRCSASAASNPARSTRDAVLGGELDGQVDREAVRVVQPERDVAGERRRVGRQVLRAPADDRAPPRSAGSSASSSCTVPASSVRANCASSRAIVARISSRLSTRCGYASAIDVDHDLRRLGHERLAPAEQPAVADRAAQDPAQDVAPPLVAGKDVVGDEERDGARVVGDDLVAEALLLERVRVVAEQLAHPRVDRREQVGVVVRRHLLDDARQPLEAHPGVDAWRTAAASASRRDGARTP